MPNPPEATTRPLGRVERALTMTSERWPVNLVVVLRLAPAPDPALVRAALDTVQGRHPALRARIATRGRTYRFAYDVAAPVPLTTATRDADDDWREAAEHELHTPLPVAAGPLVRALLLRAADGSAGELVLTAHHAVVDAPSVAGLIDELLRGCGGSRFDAAALGVPPAADDLFPARYRGASLAARAARLAAATALPEARFRRAMRRRGTLRVSTGARTIVHAHELGPGTTDAVGRTARRRRLTMGSVVQAAALRAMHRRRYEAAAVPMRLFYFPDLRPYLNPPQPASPLACYMTLAWVDLVAGAGDLWEVSQRIQDHVEASLRGGSRFTAAALIGPVMRLTLATRKLRMANTSVSHTGALALADAYGPLRLRGVHAWVSTTPVGPELALRSGTFGGRLTLDAATLDTDMDRGDLAVLVGDVVRDLEESAA